MREVKIILIGSILILGIEGLWFLKPWGKPKVLSANVIATATPSLSPSPTEVPTPMPTVKPTPKPTAAPTPIPQPKFSSEEINGLIERFASQYSVDPNMVRHLALCESGFNPFAKKLNYAGLFQFGPITWQNIRLEMGEDRSTDLRFNAEEAVQTASYALSKGKRAIWPNCGL